MANKKISQLDAGTASLTSIIPASDAAGTVTNKVTVQSILNAETRWSALVPAAPTNVSTATGNAQASVSWTAPTSLLSITDYIVQYSSDSGSTWTTFSDGTSTSTSATVTGLTNGTAYVFRVAAVNGAGSGAFSAASSATTPSSTPQSVTVSGGNSNFINGFVTYSGVSRNPYSLSGEENGRPRYVSAVQTYYGNFAKIFWTGSAWQIRVIDDSTVYASSSQDGAVPPTSGWTDTWGGNPTISY